MNYLNTWQSLDKLKKFDINFLKTAFTGWTDEDSEGTWISVGNRTLCLETFQPWDSGEPNGNKRENCGVINSKTNRWEDWPCSSQHCIICECPSHINYIVRGLCESTLLDTQFAWSVMERDLIRGYTKTKLEHIKEWRINMYNNQHTYAVLMPYENNRDPHFIGTNYWNLINDACKYDGSVSGVQNSSRILLSVNACEPHEFNCYDGTW